MQSEKKRSFKLFRIWNYCIYNTFSLNNPVALYIQYFSKYWLISNFFGTVNLRFFFLVVEVLCQTKMGVTQPDWEAALRRPQLGHLRQPTARALHASSPFRALLDFFSSSTRSGDVLLVSGCASILWDALSIESSISGSGGASSSSQKSDDCKSPQFEFRFIESALGIVKARHDLAEPPQRHRQSYYSSFKIHCHKYKRVLLNMVSDVCFLHNERMIGKIWINIHCEK